MSVAGYVDELTPDHAAGWAIDSQRPDRAVVVDLIADGTTVASGKANLFREDLRAAGVGNGVHAFHIHVPPQRQRARYEVRVRGDNAALPRSEMKPIHNWQTPLWRFRSLWRAITRRFTGQSPDPVRWHLASRFLHGAGIEIGALHHPLSLPRSARVKYVDRMGVDGLRRHYPELCDKRLVDVDIIADGELLEPIFDGSQDFVIANHFLEHTQNPLLCLSNLLRVLRPDGVLFLALPDKRYTFDIDRPVTPFEHILGDFHEGPERSRAAHFREWALLVDKVEASAVERRADALMNLDYSIHFHVWEKEGMEEMLARARHELRLPLDLEVTYKNAHEVIFIVRKRR